MAYIFTRENNLGVMRNSSTGEILISSERATLKSIGDNISIWFPGTNFGTDLSSIGTINGVTPVSVENALLLLTEVFKAAPVKITTC